jgi:hypothetical protein
MTVNALRLHPVLTGMPWHLHNFEGFLLISQEAQNWARALKQTWRVTSQHRPSLAWNSSSVTKILASTFSQTAVVMHTTPRHQTKAQIRYCPAMRNQTPLSTTPVEHAAEAYQTTAVLHATEANCCK